MYILIYYILKKKKDLNLSTSLDLGGKEARGRNSKPPICYHLKEGTAVSYQPPALQGLESSDWPSLAS